MNVQFTARHFKASPELQSYAENAVLGLQQLYDGIVSADVVVDDGQQGGVTKIAEIGLTVHRERLFAKETTDDMTKSLQACIDKLGRQLTKYKERLHNGGRHQERPEIDPNMNQ